MNDQPKPNTNPIAQSVPQFCKDAGFSVGFFYKLRLQGLAQGKPDPLSKLGARSIVFRDKGEQWLRAIAEESKAACIP
jgi:hypothetical protein